MLCVINLHGIEPKIRMKIDILFAWKQHMAVQVRSQPGRAGGGADPSGAVGVVMVNNCPTSPHMQREHPRGHN